MALHPELLEFLPAELEIQRTPPLPIARSILWSIMALFTIAVAWACVGHVDVVSVAPGKIVPSGRVKTVQPLETGVVKAIHVHEGQHVESGSLLIELDDTKVRADVERLTQERAAAATNVAILTAQLNALGTFDTPLSYFYRDVRTHESTLDVGPGAYARIAEALNEHFFSVASVNEQINQNRAERVALERRVAQLDATIPLVVERAESIHELEMLSLAPRARWLELEEKRVVQEKNREIVRAELTVKDAALMNLRQQRDALKARMRSRWLGELAGLETTLKSFDQEILKSQTRVADLGLTAPVAGTVQQLAVTTIGGVVTPAEKLMRIVPGGDALRVDAWVANRDIGFVRDGQSAEVKIETFPFTKYGVIEGTIVNVSDDAIADENLGLVYLAQVEMASSTMRVNDKRVSMSPGMAVTVEVNMGERRLIEYLLTPLMRYRDEGLTER